ncbi:MAG: nitroreductase/quinone reductase family protein [Porticoccaceae bacterium]
MKDPIVEASTSGWIAEHREKYLATNGAEGHMFDSTAVGGPGLVPTLLLTTTGRKSGEPRIMPLIYSEAGNGGYVVIASKGGALKHPAWYLNLLAQPEVEVQVKDDKFRARARTALGEERTALWAQQQALAPIFDGYQQSADEREIPVVVLERI